MNVRVIQPDSIHVNTTAFACSQATRMGDLMFLAGQVPHDVDSNLIGKGDVGAQTEQVFRNINDITGSHGFGFGSSWQSHRVYNQARIPPDHSPGSDMYLQ